MSYVKTTESRGVGAIAATDMAGDDRFAPAAPTAPRTPAQQIRLTMSRRAPGARMPTFPFTVGVRGTVLPQPKRVDFSVARVPAPSLNFAAPLSRPAIVPVIEYPGAATTYSGLVPGKPPATVPQISAPSRVMTPAESPRGFVDVPAPTVDLGAEVTPSKKRSNLLVYGGIAAAALGAWYLLRRRG